MEFRAKRIQRFLAFLVDPMLDYLSIVVAEKSPLHNTNPWVE
jgi:hypothetical protein